MPKKRYVRNGGQNSLPLKEFQKAVEAASLDGTSAEAATRLSQLGLSWLKAVVNRVESDVEPAIQCFTRALALCDKGCDAERWASDHYHLGVAELLRVPESLDAAERAIVEFRLVLEDRNILIAESEARALNSLGAALRRSAMAGRADYSELITIQTQAVIAWRSLKQPDGLARALLNAGNVRINDPNGDPSDNASHACQYYEEAVRHAIESGDARLEAACHFSVAMALRDRSGYEPDEDLASAAEHLERAIDIYRQDEDKTEWAEALAALASLQVQERSRYQRPSHEAIRRVIELLKASVKCLPAQTRPGSRANAFFYLGQAFLEGESLASVRRASEAFGASRRLRTKLGVVLDLACAEEAEANALSDLPEPAAQRRATRLYARAIARLGSTHPVDRFRIQRNLGFAKMKNESWSAAVTAFQEAVKTGMDSDLLKLSRHGLFREGDIAECHSSVAYCKLRMGHYEEALIVLEQARQVCASTGKGQLDFKKLLASIQDELVAIPILTPVGSAAVVIAPGTRILKKNNVIHLPGIESLYASLHPNRSRGRAGWLQSMTVWRGDQSVQTLGARMQFLDDLLRELWTGFAQPVLNSVQTVSRKLVIVPHSGLQIFPIHAAYSEEPGGRRYVATDWSVRYVPSLSFLQDAAPRRIPNLEKQLAIGLSRYRDPRLRQLALAEAEAKTATEAKDGQAIGRLLCGSEVQRDQVVRLLQNFEILHFACHATWGADPNDSALQLWASESGKRDELGMEAIEGELDLSLVRLAVLSACESGVVEHIFAPDEFAGLPGAFLRAGSAGVISSLWAVHDLASFLLWSRFYEELRQKKMPEEALMDSQRWLRELSVKALQTIHMDYPAFSTLVKVRTDLLIRGLSPEQRPFSHPLLWAPFVHYGA